MIEVMERVLDIGEAVLGNPTFWIVVASVVGLIVLVIVYRKLKLRALGQLQYARYFSTDGIFAGESLELVEIARNPTLFPLFFVEIDFFVPAGLNVDGIDCTKLTKSTGIFHIPPRSTVKRTHTVSSNRRDYYKLQNVTVNYRNNEFVFDEPIELYVYPDKYYADSALAEKIKLTGDAIAKRRMVEDPFYFSGIRQYREGDSMRRINFKASLRSYSGGERQLMCNFYETTQNPDSMIYLDLSESGNVDNFEAYKENLERGLRCACHLFCQACLGGGRVGFVANCATHTDKYVQIDLGSGNLHTKKLLECFAQISPYARRDHSIYSLLGGAATLPAGTDIYFITPMIDNKTAELIRSLERVGKQVNVIKL